MVMEIGASAPQRISPTNIRVSRCTNKQALEKESNRENKVLKIPKQSISCPEERFIGRQMGSGPITTQRLYSVPKIPLTHIARSEAPVAQILLDCGTGLKGRILARPSIPSDKSLSRVRVQRPVLEVQMHAIWPQYCAKNIYEGDGTCNQNYGIGGHIRPHISGRYAHNFTNSGKMLGTQGPCHDNTTRIRLDNKYREIPSTTSSDLRLAGSTLRPHNTHSKCYSEKHGRVQNSTGFCTQTKFHYKTHINASSRSSELGRTFQPNCSYSHIQNKGTAEKILRSKLGYTYSSLKELETQPYQMGIYAHSAQAVRQPTTYNNNTDRCITQRVGIPNRPVYFPRRIRPINERLLNKHIGTFDNMVCIVESNQSKPGDTNNVRQLDGSSSCPTQHFNSISPINDLRTNLEKSNQDGMDTHSITHPREIQYCSRPIEQEHNIVDRMVTSTTSLQENHENESQPTNRPVRHKTEQSTRDIHFTMSRPESSRGGCHGNLMGQMGSSIPLSPVRHDFEGFTQIDGITVQECDIDYTGHTNQTLVYGTKTTPDPINSDESVPATDSSRQTRNSSHSYQTPRLEIIKQAYNRQFPNCPEAVTLMATPIRKSSIAEYEKKWSMFMSFVKSKNIPFDDISITTVINFLTYLFYERHLSPNTVAHYKSALVIPLQVHFNIDLNGTAFKGLLRAMNLLRPNQPVAAPAWSLNKVLTFLEGLTTPLSVDMLLKKTAFLLMLATGWRISELHACVRNREYCYLTAGTVLHIRPHPSFLAKNECTQRCWDFKEIKPLRLRDGSISRLCPATTTQEYLLRTHEISSGNLFLTPNNHSRTLTVHKLSSHICQVIGLADPVAKIKVHDVRKYASSCSFVNTMLVGDLVSAMNWSSPGTFFKFYFTQTEPLRTTVALPVCQQ